MQETSTQIPCAVRRQLSTWVRQEYPLEACGLLLGRGSDRRIFRATLARNTAEDRRRSYLLAPQDFVSASREADSMGLEILGIWHSHPDRPAQPSRADLEAAWTGYAYLILGVTELGVTEFRSWQLLAGSFEEEPLDVQT